MSETYNNMRAMTCNPCLVLILTDKSHKENTWKDKKKTLLKLQWKGILKSVCYDITVAIRKWINIFLFVEFFGRSTNNVLRYFGILVLYVVLKISAYKYTESRVFSIHKLIFPIPTNLKHKHDLYFKFWLPRPPRRKYNKIK